jgi:hypothetical protein
MKTYIIQWMDDECNILSEFEFTTVDDLDGVLTRAKEVIVEDATQVSIMLKE